MEFKGKTEEEISFFILDAGNDPKWKDARHAIKQFFPRATMYVCSGGIQRDFENCPVFALHHAFQSSKIPDLFAYLEKSRSGFALTSENGETYFAFDMFNLPPNLVMTTQGSKRILETYFKQHPNLKLFPVKKNEPNFHDFILRHSILMETIDTSVTPSQKILTLENKFIIAFRKKQKAKIQEYAEKTPERDIAYLLTFHVQIELQSLQKEILPSYDKRPIADIMTVADMTRQDISASENTANQTGKQVPAAGLCSSGTQKDGQKLERKEETAEEKNIQNPPSKSP